MNSVPRHRLRACAFFSLRLVVATLSFSPSAHAQPATPSDRPWTLERLEHAPPLDTPPGYVPMEEIRYGWVATGTVLALSSWVTSAAVGIALGREASVLAVPVVGPYVAIGSISKQGGERAGLFLAGTAQTAGVVFILVGVLDKKTTLVRYAGGEASWVPHPGGLGISASF